MSTNAAPLFDRSVISNVNFHRVYSGAYDFITGEYKAPQTYLSRLKTLMRDVATTGILHLDTGETIPLDSPAAGLVMQVINNEYEAQYNLMKELPKTGVKNETKLMTLL